MSRAFRAATGARAVESDPAPVHLSTFAARASLEGGAKAPHAPRGPVLHVLFWVAVAVCAFGQVAVLRAVFTGRTPGAAAPDAARRRRAGEILWAIVPACMLVLVLVLTWQAMRTNTPTVTRGEPAGTLTLLR